MAEGTQVPRAGPPSCRLRAPDVERRLDQGLSRPGKAGPHPGAGPLSTWGCRRMSALNRTLVALTALSLGFVAFSQTVSLGAVRTLDGEAQRAVERLWTPNLQLLFQGVAVLGGIEVTTVLA